MKAHSTPYQTLIGMRNDLAVGLYLKGMPSYQIVNAFKHEGISISPKTILNRVRKRCSEGAVKGYDPWHKKQTYHWPKRTYRGRLGWYTTLVAGKIKSIMTAFWSWFYYCRKHPEAEFDVDAVLSGERPP